MGRVEGMIVVVTGAAGGRGAAEARLLAREGATVIATDLAEDDPQLGDGIAYRRLDVANREHWSELGAWIEQTHGRVAQAQIDEMFVDNPRRFFARAG
jgi:NAD(P)-dependent dehydrogenase (short-subunit alcohol dehydrogenase family)